MTGEIGLWMFLISHAGIWSLCNWPDCTWQQDASLHKHSGYLWMHSVAYNSLLSHMYGSSSISIFDQNLYKCVFPWAFTCPRICFRLCRERILGNTNLNRNGIWSDFTNSVANFCCEPNYPNIDRQTEESALQLFQSMPLAGVTPNVISYSATISSCEKGAQWQHALALWQEMPSKHVLPNLYTHNSTISSCEKATKWQLALEIFGHVQNGMIRPDVAPWFDPPRHESGPSENHL